MTKPPSSRQTAHAPELSVAAGGLTVNARRGLIDGMLIVCSAPNIPHQRAALVLSLGLEAACPEDLIVFGAGST